MLRRNSFEILGTVLLLSTFGEAREGDDRGRTDDREPEPCRRKPRAWTRWHGAEVDGRPN